MHNGNYEKEEKQKYLKSNIERQFLSNCVRYKTTNPGISQNIKLDKFQNNYTQPCHV